MTVISISAVGDIMMSRVQLAAARREKNTFAFDYVFEEVARYIGGSDLAIGNLETTFSGPEDRYVTFSERGWPQFNCPDDLARTLRSAGFNVLTTANNHCLDRGSPGVKRTLDILDEHGFHHTGTYRSLEESKQELIVEVKGVKIGIAAFTAGLNNGPLPPHEPWLVDLINDTMLRRICNLKGKADIVIVCLHAGVQRAALPTPRQRARVQACFGHGADIILGAHPHVLQPMDLVWAADTDSVERQRFVIHSLGNFTARLWKNDFRTLCSLILQLKVQVDENGVRLSSLDAIPTWVNPFDSEFGRYKVLPVSNYLAENSTLRPEEQAGLQQAWEYTMPYINGGRKLLQPNQ